MHRTSHTTAHSNRLTRPPPTTVNHLLVSLTRSASPTNRKESAYRRCELDSIQRRGMIIAFLLTPFTWRRTITTSRRARSRRIYNVLKGVHHNDISEVWSWFGVNLTRRSQIGRNVIGPCGITNYSWSPQDCTVHSSCTWSTDPMQS